MNRENPGRPKISPSVVEQAAQVAKSAIGILDGGFNYIWANDEFVKNSGKSIKEIIGRNHFHIFSSEENRAVFEAVRDTGIPYSAKSTPYTFVNNKQEQTIYWDWSLIPITASDGTSKNYVLTLTDTTELASAARRMAKNEELYLSVLDNADAVLAVIDRQGNWAYMNKAGMKKFGYTKDEICSMSVKDVTHPDYMGESKQLLASLWRKEIDTFTIEKKYVCKDRTTFWGRITCSPITDQSGNVESIIGLMTDISESHEAREKRMRRIAIDEAVMALEKGSYGKSEKSFTDAVNKTMQSLATVLETDVAFTAIFNDERTEVVEHYMWEAPRTRARKEDLVGFDLKGISGIIGLLATGEPLEINDLEKWEGCGDESKDLWRGMGIKSIIILPLISEELFHGVVTTYCKKEKCRWTSEHLQLLDLVGASVMSVIGRKKSEESLRKTESNQRAVLDNTEHGFVLVDRDVNIISYNRVANERAKAVYGTDMREGSSLYEFVDKDDMISFQLNMQSAFNGKKIRLDKSFVSPDGSVRWFEMGYSPVLDEFGVVSRVYFSSTDITERKNAEIMARNSELMYKTVADFTYDWEYWIGPDGKMVYCSPSCEEITGYSQEEFMADSGLLYNIIAPEDAIYAEHMKEVGEFVANCPIDFRIVTKSGEKRWLAHACKPAYDADGTFVGRRGSNRDITDKKRAEDDLSRLRFELERAYEREKKISSELQKAIIPDIDMQHGDFRVYARYLPAYEEADVGGDFYDSYITPDGRIAVVLGDVSGKGLNAAVHTAMIKFMLRAFAFEDPEPASVMNRVNNAFHNYIKDETFITCFYGVIDCKTGVMEFCDAGQEEPLLYCCQKKKMQTISQNGMVLGVFPGAEYKTGKINLSGDSILTVYSDGITDTHADGVYFEVDGLSKTISSCDGKSVEEIVKEVIDRSSDYCKFMPHDDRTILIVRRTAETTSRSE